MSDSARRELAAGDVAAWLREHPAFFSDERSECCSKITREPFG